MDVCSDCSFSEVMPDGSLFCAIYEQLVHGNQTCLEWINETDSYVYAERMYEFDKED